MAVKTLPAGVVTPQGGTMGMAMEAATVVATVMGMATGTAIIMGIMMLLKMITVKGMPATVMIKVVEKRTIIARVTTMGMPMITAA